VSGTPKRIASYGFQYRFLFCVQKLPGVEFLQADRFMLRAPTLVLLFFTAATAAWAEDGAKGPGRWLLERQEDLQELPGERACAVARTDPLSR
jgi:hypothetical protein